MTFDLKPYAHIIQALMEGEVVQLLPVPDSNAWRDRDSKGVLHDIWSGYLPDDFRIKPRTITVTYEVPEPMREVPGHHDQYWCVCGEAIVGAAWLNDSDDRASFRLGIYRTEAEAQQALDAQRAAMDRAMGRAEG